MSHGNAVTVTGHNHNFNCIEMFRLIQVFFLSYPISRISKVLIIVDRMRLIDSIPHGKIFDDKKFPFLTSY